jgi:hypothetical protein
MLSSQQDPLNAIRLTWILLAVLGIGGCATTPQKLDLPSAERTQVLVERLSGTVGIYYSPEFNDYIGSGTGPTALGSGLQVPLGKSSIEMVHDALTSLFGNVVPLADWAVGKPTAESIELVIVPRITSFSASSNSYAPVGSWPPAAEGWPPPPHSEIELPVHIGYEFSIYAPTGEKLASIDLVGRALAVEELTLAKAFSMRDLFGATIAAAIRNAFAHLVVSLSAHSEILKRFKAEPLRATQAPGGRPGQAAVSSETQLQHTKPRVMLTVMPHLQSQTHAALKGVKCMERALNTLHDQVSLTPSSTVQRAVFPWLEAGVIPNQDEELIKLLERPSVALRLRELGVHYLLFPSLETRMSPPSGSFWCGGGLGGGAGCFGRTTAERTSTIAAKLWDLTTGHPVTTTYSAQSKGTSWIAGLIFPTWHTAPTEEEACLKVSRQIAESLPH